MTDGYVVYASLVAQSNGRLLDLGCWAHARRKFDESCVVTSHPLALQALAWIWKLYDIEDRMAEAGPDALLAARQSEAVPVLNRLHERLVEAQPTAGSNNIPSIAARIASESSKRRRVQNRPMPLTPMVDRRVHHLGRLVSSVRRSPGDGARERPRF